MNSDVLHEWESTWTSAFKFQQNNSFLWKCLLIKQNHFSLWNISNLELFLVSRTTFFLFREGQSSPVTAYSRCWHLCWHCVLHLSKAASFSCAACQHYNSSAFLLTKSRWRICLQENAALLNSFLRHLDFERDHQQWQPQHHHGLDDVAVELEQLVH